MTNITVKQKPAYITTDGKEFTDRTEAVCWQTTLDTSTDIANFLDTHYGDAGNRHRKMLTHVLLKWEQGKAMQNDTE